MKKKNLIYIALLFSVFIVTTIVIFMIFKINMMYNEYQEQMISLENDYENMDLVQNYEEASSSIGNTVEESEKENETVIESKIEEKNEKSEAEKKSTVEEKKIQEKTTEEKSSPKELCFIIPVEGEITKRYCKENLSYSETLKEWTTHNGVDIEANLTTVVKASEEGTVKSIKNDPRYGITIIITHSNGFETRYSNLLTSEFVKVGEKVDKGQAIGTVGNTASFEILDKPHLHFEILKENEYIDPEQMQLRKN